MTIKDLKCLIENLPNDFKLGTTQNKRIAMQNYNNILGCTFSYNTSLNIKQRQYANTMTINDLYDIIYNNDIDDSIHICMYNMHNKKIHCKITIIDNYNCILFYI